MDKITLERIKTAHPKIRKQLEEIYTEICSRLTGRSMCRFAFVYRTNEEQDALYAQGRTTKGKVVTNARGGQSYHNYGLAVDIVLITDTDGNGSFETASWDRFKDFDGDGKSDWAEVVYVFKMFGWEWGGDWRRFPDYPHFQKPMGYTIADLMKMSKDSTGYVVF